MGCEKSILLLIPLEDPKPPVVLSSLDTQSLPPNVSAMAFQTPFLVAGFSNGTIQIWNIAVQALEIQYHSHQDTINTILMTRESIIACSNDGFFSIINKQSF